MTFEERSDLALYNPDARAWDVRDEGKIMSRCSSAIISRGRPSAAARGCPGFRNQSDMDGKHVRPIVINVMNFSKGAEGQKALISLTTRKTLFHEFGHGPHGMLSQVTYPSISGTSVVRDFVEFPSQVYEHWLLEPPGARPLCAPCRDGRADPQRTRETHPRARRSTSAFGTVEFTCLGAGRPRTAPHESPDEDFDVVAFERDALKRLACPPKSSCATARRTSTTFRRLRATRPAIIRICGPRCRTTTASLPSRRSGKRLRSGDGAQRLKDYVRTAGGTRGAGRGLPRISAAAIHEVAALLEGGGGFEVRGRVLSDCHAAKLVRRASTPRRCADDRQRRRAASARLGRIARNWDRASTARTSPAMTPKARSPRGLRMGDAIRSVSRASARNPRPPDGESVHPFPKRARPGAPPARPAQESAGFSYDGATPGPLLLRVRQGEEGEASGFVNRLDQPTTLHWQGLRGENAVDGVGNSRRSRSRRRRILRHFCSRPARGPLSLQPSLQPHGAEQIARGMSGVLIVDERAIRRMSTATCWS